MENFRHFSFDMWNTLIEPNALYGEARERFLVNATGLRAKTVKALYSVVKSEIDHTTEAMTHRGETSPFASLASLIAEVVTWSNDAALRSPCAAELSAAFQEAAKQHMPLVRKSVPDLMKGLRSAGKTVSITSNTNFILGSTLQELVEEWGDVVRFSIYSDEVLVAKPDSAIFQLVLDGAREIHGSALRPSEIMHVGDNVICDIAGATKFGMMTRRVTDDSCLTNLAQSFNFALVN